MPAIRNAVPSDARALAQLAEDTFRETFGAANTPEDMELHCRASYGEAVQAAEIADPKRLTLLCEEGGRLVGYAQLHWGGAPGCVAAGSPAEIGRLYVSSDWHGRGLAHDLMRACLEAAAVRGSDVVWLGVWEHNPRAQAFYRKFGFVEVGEHRFTLGRDPQRDLVMARGVSAV
ncbi:MAG: GNAT family N-acetyltransferase [Meiothermus sp.]|nr:GNAT family N-acetyltransferase [Meiothermus sp.]